MVAHAGAERRDPRPEAVNLCHRGKRTISGGQLDDAPGGGLEDGKAALRAGVLRLHVVQIVPVVLGLVVVL